MTEPAPAIIFDQDEELAQLVQGENDASLLGLMADRAKDGFLADAAFKEFYARHKVYLWGMCCSVSKKLGGEAWATDIFNDTFAQAYEKAGQFKVPPETDVDSVRRRVRGWLGTIATNRLRSHLRNHECEHTLDDTSWERFSDNAEARKEAEDQSEQALRNPKLEVIQAALDSLTEKEQEVLRVTYQYFRGDKEHQRLPNKVVADLAEVLGTTPENLRQIRRRALKKIAEFVSKYQSQASTEHEKTSGN